MQFLIHKFCAIAARHPDLLTAYKGDLDHDAKALAASERGDRFVWLLRDHGTELFRVAIGRDPVWLTYWLDSKSIGPSAAKYRAYDVRVTADGGVGDVKPISHDEARALARLPCAPGVTPEKPFRLS